MAGDLEVRKSETDPRGKLAARVAKQFSQALKGKASLELTETGPDLGPHEWEIYAYGPYQDEDSMPGRIIKLGEKAYIVVVVWMNDSMCQTITSHRDKIELNIFTSDTQRMRALTGLDHYCCIQTEPGHCWYVYVWDFEPGDDACVYETNICARICNCSNEPLKEYAGFVRHVFDFDPETLWPRPPADLIPDKPDVPADFPDFPRDTWPWPRTWWGGWGFDRPIRYMVYDPDAVCDCVDPDNFCEPVLSGP